MILKATELGMPDALGEFGMNPLAQLKQEILETLRATHTPHSMEQVIAMFHRDARSNEIVEVLNDLTRTKQIVVQQSATGSRLVSAVFTRQNTEEAMMQTLREMMRT
jgi:aminoglycoside phosphotransferase family enzyme